MESSFLETAFAHTHTSAPTVVSPNAVCVDDEFLVTLCVVMGGGVRAQAVLHKLGSMLTRPKASNLVLTGIIAKVAQCPDPLVHAYLFPAAALRGDPAPWPNVVTTLRKVGCVGFVCGCVCGGGVWACLCVGLP